MEPCKACQNDIPENATRCGHCGYEPSNITMRVFAIAGLGFLFTLTGVGAIIGIPMMIGALYGEWKVKDWKPTTHAP